MRLSGAVLLVGTVGALACGCAGSGPATRSPSTPPAGAGSPGPIQTFLLSDAPFPLTLSVSGNGKAIITYASGPGDPATRTTTGLPWTTTLNLSPNNVVISTTLTARDISDTTDAWVSCKVTLAEAVLKEKSAKGPHAFADCSMTPTPQLRISPSSATR
jgi:hypothetical protein